MASMRRRRVRDLDTLSPHLRLRSRRLDPCAQPGSRSIPFGDRAGEGQMRWTGSIRHEFLVLACVLLTCVLVASAITAWYELGRFAAETASDRLVERARS